jgi:hypothetical protein
LKSVSFGTQKMHTRPVLNGSGRISDNNTALYALE